MSELRKSAFSKSGIDNATANRLKKSSEMRKDKRASIFVTKRRMLSVNGDSSMSTQPVGACESISNTEIENIVKSIINVHDLKESLSGLQALRVYLCSHFEDENDLVVNSSASYIEQILAVRSDHSCRCIDVIIAYLAYYKSEEVQSDAAWCLTNLSASCFSNDQLVLFLPAIPICLQIISFFNSSGSPVLKEQCCWAIGNVVSATVEDSQSVPASGSAVVNVRGAVLANGALYTIIEYLYCAMAELRQLQTNTTTTSVTALVSVGRRLQTVLWVLCNLIRTNSREDECDDTGVVTGEMLVQAVESVMNSAGMSSVSLPNTSGNNNNDPAAIRFFCGLFELLSLPFAAARLGTSTPEEERTLLFNSFFQVVQEVSWVAVYLSTKNVDFVVQLSARCRLTEVCMCFCHAHTQVQMFPLCLLLLIVFVLFVLFCICVCRARWMR